MTNTPRPKVENCPGIVWRPMANGAWEARWQARTDLVERGWEPKSVRLWTGFELNDLDKAWLIGRCQSLQDSMLVWGRGGIAVVARFDGTLSSLVATYQTDEDSPYHKLRYQTRRFYDALCRRIIHDHGDQQIADIKARDVLRWHREWRDGTKTVMAHALVGMLRTTVGFGATFLEDDGCVRLRGVLSGLRFEMSKPRTEALTADQVVDIRKAARAAGDRSIALAQAIQFECTLRQKDCIGEWVPVDEPGVSSVLDAEGNKWLRGIRWEKIDENLVLRHTTSKRLKDITVDLKLAPMVVEELTADFPDLLVTDPATKKVTVNRHLLPSSGPVIAAEATGLPWVAHRFRHRWRRLADSVGIPSTVRNMDSRAGAITEALSSGARMQAVRKAATHSTEAMTQKYSRGDEAEVAEVMQLRAARRKNKP